MNGSQQLLSGRYEVGRLLGRGGMAVVHLGRDSRLDRQVAIKLLRLDLADDPTAQTRFRREAQSAAALNHPSIVAVFDTGEDDFNGGIGGPTGHNIPFIVMEYVQGMTLREMLRDSSRRDATSTIVLPPSGQPTGPHGLHDRDQGIPLPVDQAVGITAHVLEALGYSHSRGIVHRDIKPGNVMLTPTGQVKVMDFGIARALADTSATMTSTSTVIGTAQYLSPEQARGEQVDARSDLYSTGCLLYELLTGRPPFVGDSPVAVAYQHVREQPLPPSVFNPAVGDELDRVVLHALAKDRTARYQTAEAFRDDLLNALDGRPVDAPPTTILAAPMLASAAPSPAAAPTRSTPYEELDAEEPRKNRAGAWIAVIIALLVVAGLGWFLADRYFAQSPTMVAVPTVTGMPKDQARQTLESSGFTYAEGKSEPSTTIAQDSVISQDPTAGAQAAAKSKVTVVLSSGPDSVAVPDLAGKSQQDARTALQNAGLSVGNVDTVDSQSVAKNLVVGSDPAVGAQLAKGTEVNLQVSSGQVTMPDVTGMAYLAARDKLVALGLKVRATYVTSSRTPYTVVSMDPAAGSVDQGSTITLQLSRPPVVTPTTTPPTTTPSPTPSPTTDPSESPTDSPTTTPGD